MGPARRQYTKEFKLEAVRLPARRSRPLRQMPGSWGLPLRGCVPGGTGVTGGMRVRRSAPIRRRRSRMPVRI